MGGAEEILLGTWVSISLTWRTSLFCFQPTMVLQRQDILALTVDQPHHDGPVGVMGTVGYHHWEARPSLLGLGRTAALSGCALPLLPHHHPLPLPSTCSSCSLVHETWNSRAKEYCSCRGTKDFQLYLFCCCLWFPPQLHLSGPPCFTVLHHLSPFSVAPFLWKFIYKMKTVIFIM